MLEPAWLWQNPFSLEERGQEQQRNPALEPPGQGQPCFFLRKTCDLLRGERNAEAIGWVWEAQAEERLPGSSRTFFSQGLLLLLSGGAGSALGYRCASMAWQFASALLFFSFLFSFKKQP